MASTFLELTNKLLRRTNEVEMTESNFASARGVQALAKDFVNDVINKINAVEFEWPFNAFEATVELEPGVNEYAWPEGFKVADWTSFQLSKDDVLNTTSKTLWYVNRSQWYKHQRDHDRDSDPDGLSIPTYVFEGHGSTFGVAPVPNEAYELKFRYYKTPTSLVLYSDETTIPEEFEYVIINGGLWHMNLFRENVEAADRMEKAFKNDITEMTNVLVSKPDNMTSTMIVRGR